MSMLAGGKVFLHGTSHGARQPKITTLVTRIEKAKNLMISPLHKAHESPDLAHGSSLQGSLRCSANPERHFCFHH
jgi:hypothetical protein